ncbi:hypothetical protein [Amycolatopsis sp. NPDC004079]
MDDPNRGTRAAQDRRLGDPLLLRERMKPRARHAFPDPAPEL